MVKDTANGSGPAEVGPWAKEKLEALARYLDFYTTVLKHQHWCRTIYFDGFAGGGRAAIRQQPAKIAPNPNQVPLLEGPPVEPELQEVIDGSPRLALGIANPFNRYIFVDPDPERVAELKELEAGNEDRVSVLELTAAEGIDWMLEKKISKATHRGVAFLDPFGAQLDWASIQKLAGTGLFEVVINFALNMGIVRMLPNSAEVPDAWASRLDSYFGGRAWFDEVYHKPFGLFGQGELQKRSDYMDRLLKLYRSKLKDAFGHVSTARLIKNTKGAPLYYLLWAGPHRKGLEGADYILKMGEKLSRGR